MDELSISQMSWTDAQRPIGDAYVAWVEVLGCRPRSVVDDHKQAIWALCNEWSAKMPTREKKVRAFLRMLLDETFGSEAEQAADHLGVS